MALSDSDFQRLLSQFFGQEKAAKFPTALVTAMREFSEASFAEGIESRAGDLDQAYDQGFSEGFDSGTHQAYVECNPDQPAETEKLHEFMSTLRARHRESWRAIAKADYAGCKGVIFKRGGTYFGWRVVAKDGLIVAKTDLSFSTELGAKLDARNATGLAFL